MSKKKWDWKKEPEMCVAEAKAIHAKAIRDGSEKMLVTFFELEKMLGGASLHLHANVNAEQLLPANELRALALKARAGELPPGFGHPRSEPVEDEPVADVLDNEEAPPDDENDDPAE